MWRRKTAEAPYGWLSYRQNLIVLYEDLGRPDGKIDALIEKTAYEGGRARPAFPEQWADLNEMELRLFRLLDDTRLIAETERKFIDAEQMGLPGLAALRERFRGVEEGETAGAERHALATTLLEAMFVKYSYRYAERAKRAEVSQRLTLLGLVLIGVPTLLVFLGPMVEAVSRSIFPAGERELTFVAPSSTPIKGVLEPLVWASSEFGAFFIVMYFGIAGAYFSRLFGYAKKMERLRWNEMDLVYSSGALAVRLLVGALAAVILFFLMMGKILSGPLFLEGDFSLWWLGPEADGYYPLIPLRPSADFARLIVWCTLAGFSERFVPDRFAELEESARGTGRADNK